MRITNRRTTTTSGPAPGSTGPNGATVKLALSAPLNNPATGTPSIAGTTTVGQTLTAGAGNIADDDGLPSGTFPTGYSLKWYRVNADGVSNRTEITGETSDSYTLTAADEGKKIIVEVSFTDGVGYEETRESVPTAAVAAAAEFVCDALDLTGRTSLWTSTLEVGDRDGFRRKYHSGIRCHWVR